MSEREALHVLVVDDDADTRANLCDILELDGYKLETAGSVAETLRRDNWAELAVILLDRRLPDGTAEDILPRLRKLAPDAAVIVVTGYADLQGSIAALRQGAADYIIKPINPEALRASLHRVAERRRLAREKERSEAAFRTLVEAAPCVILMLSPDRKIVYFSPFAEKLTGYSADEVKGKAYFNTLAPDHAVQAALQQRIERILAGTPTRGYEAPIVGKTGLPRWLIWNAEAMHYEGEPAILMVGLDITDFREAQERVLQAERLAAIGQMMTGLAHESGNALARSQACLEMLALEVEDRPEALDLIARIQKAQDHLRQLYEEVRGYAAPLKLERETWELNGIWRQAWSNLDVLRQGRNAVLCEHADGVDLGLPVDNFRLEQVFRNIMENSLAACRDPVVIDIVCSESQLNGKPALAVAVRDNGPGLKPEQQRRIFDPFYTTKTKGTGLGMAIAKRIVEAHAGAIAVAADVGRGAEIRVTLPRTSP